MTRHVFYDTGSGDIYAGPSRETIERRMRRDGYIDLSTIFEVDGDTVLPIAESRAMNSLKREAASLLFTQGLAWCIASENL